MKWLVRIFYLLGFILEYIVPIFLFGIVTPLVHGKLDEGLTAIGVIAICIAAVIALLKFNSLVRQWDKSSLRAVVLAAIKAIPLILFVVFVEWLRDFAIILTTYAWRIVPIFLVGLIFDITAEILESKEEDV